MDAVFALIAQLNLPIKSDKTTLGGGNCFFHALVQQGRREGVEIHAPNHRWLRERVCDFALNSTNPMVLEMRKNSEAASISPTWDEFWGNMRRNGVFVEGPVVEVCSVYLSTRIWIISPANNKHNPWLEIKVVLTFPPEFLSFWATHQEFTINRFSQPWEWTNC